MEIKGYMRRVSLIFFVFVSAFTVTACHQAGINIIYTDDPEIWDRFKDIDPRAGEKPAMLRKPREIFSDEKVIALAEAAVRGRVDAIKNLVEDGVDVNAKGWNGFTPLYSALKAKNKRGVEALLQLGANPNLLSDLGAAPIHTAADHVVDPYFLRLILQYGGDPNLVESGGFCRLPLSAAMFKMNSSKIAKEKINLLVEYGADVNRLNWQESGWNCISQPISVSVRAIPRYDLIYYLLELGADPHLSGPEGIDLPDAIRRTEGYLMTKEEKKWRKLVMERIGM